MNKALIDQMILKTEPYVWIMSSVNRAVISPTKSLIYKVLALMIWIQRNRFKPNRTKVYQRYLKISYYMYLSISWFSTAIKVMQRFIRHFYIRQGMKK